MEKLNLNNLEETLFIPMRGRVFASKKFPYILNDKKAIEIAEKFPKFYMDMKDDTEYTLMASAIRSTNMDRYIQNFFSKNPEGTIICVGAGIETTFYRNDNKKAIWYEIDLKEVADIRRKIFGENKRDIVLDYSMFDYDWINIVLKNAKPPYLIIASGVFHYFEKKSIIEFLRKVKELNEVEVVFDTVSKLGMKATKRYMKKLGKDDAYMYFYVENANKLVEEIGENTIVLDEKDYYSFIKNKKDFKFITRISMNISDFFHMVKMVHLKL